MNHSIDIEITNRCNAKCHFCPRDQTPHQGIMRPEAFDQALARAIEYRDLAQDVLGVSTTISLCGLGEPLLNPHAVDYVRKVRAAGFRCQMSSNAALLTEAKGRALVEAGLQEILINAGDRNEEYEAVYQLPFEKTRANVARFVEIAGDSCLVSLVLVDHHRDERHLFEMKYFWGKHGVQRFFTYDVINRGGALFVDHMQYEKMPQLAQAQQMLESHDVQLACGAPFGYLFIGYDGQYYLCCSDWKKETPMGSIFDQSFRDVMEAKINYMVTRTPVCRTCNLDPINRLTEELAAAADGTSTDEKVQEVLESLINDGAVVQGLVRQLGFEPAGTANGTRKLIPVTSE